MFLSGSSIITIFLLSKNKATINPIIFIVPSEIKEEGKSMLLLYFSFNLRIMDLSANFSMSMPLHKAKHI